LSLPSDLAKNASPNSAFKVLPKPQKGKVRVVLLADIPAFLSLNPEKGLSQVFGPFKQWQAVDLGQDDFEALTAWRPNLFEPSLLCRYARKAGLDDLMVADTLLLVGRASKAPSPAKGGAVKTGGAGVPFPALATNLKEDGGQPWLLPPPHQGACTKFQTNGVDVK